MDWAFWFGLVSALGGLCDLILEKGPRMCRAIRSHDQEVLRRLSWKVAMVLGVTILGVFLVGRSLAQSNAQSLAVIPFGNTSPKTQWIAASLTLPGGGAKRVELEQHSWLATQAALRLLSEHRPPDMTLRDQSELAAALEQAKINRFVDDSRTVAKLQESLKADAYLQGVITSIVVDRSTLAIQGENVTTLTVEVRLSLWVVKAGDTSTEARREIKGKAKELVRARGLEADPPDLQERLFLKAMDEAMNELKQDNAYWQSLWAAVRKWSAQP